MATRAKSITRIETWKDDCHVITWSGLTNASSDDGDPLEMPGSADRSVQVTGTFGAGGEMTIEGSNDGTNYAPLTDPQGNALEFAATGIEAITEVTRYVRPRVTGGDGATNLVVTLLVRRPH